MQMKSTQEKSPPDLGALAGCRILLIVNKDWGFLTYRTPLALALKDAGAEVLVAGGATGREEEIRELGLTFHPIPFDRSSINPLKELRTLLHIYLLLRQVQPDIVHNIAVKASLYGSLAGLSAGTPRIINSLTGLGHLFTAQTGITALVRWLLAPVYLMLGRAKRLHYIFFNSDDQQRFIAAGFAVASRSSVITGSGVDTEKFLPAATPVQEAVVVLCARLLWDKGVGDLVAALRILKAKGATIRAIIAGAPDFSNPKAIPQEQLVAWQKEGLVEIPGFIADVPQLLKAASIAVLPSYYGEGVPLFLLEALATGLPIITTDSAGCKETVIDGANGILVPPHDPTRLASAIEKLASEPTLRHQMGKRGRTFAETRFSTSKINSSIITLYQRILKDRRDS